ncbi:MAG: hypothetical protein OEN55_08940 [Alphaproteobacteria bacterium]|nr:hypothetical protein [Alphaproteobacteria bacterium]
MLPVIVFWRWASGVAHSSEMFQSIENGIRLPRQIVRFAMPAKPAAHVGELRQNLGSLGVPVAKYLPAVCDRGPVCPRGGGKPTLSPVQIGKADVNSAARDPRPTCALRGEDPETELFGLRVTALAAVKIDEAHGDHRRIGPVATRPLFRSRDGGAIKEFRAAEIAKAARGDGRAVQIDRIIGFFRGAAAKRESRTGEIALPERPATFRQ